MSERDGRDGSVIDELLSNPPANLDELQRRLLAFEPKVARRDLLESLGEAELNSNQRSMLCDALASVGVGQDWDAFGALVQDQALSIPFRSDVLRALRQIDAPRAEQLSSSLPSEDHAALVEHGMVSVLQDIEDDPDHARVFSELLEGMSSEEQQALVEAAEVVRKKAGTPAALVWSAALRNRRLGSLRGVLLEPVIEESGSAGEELLDALVRKAPGKKARRQLQKALLRLRTAGIEPRKAQHSGGQAFVSSCDGQGAVIVVGCFPGPGGTVRAVDLVLRLTEDVRDAFMLPAETMREVHLVLDEMREGAQVEFAEIPLSVAADLVAGAAQRTRSMGRKFTREMKAPVALFERAANRGGANAAAKPDTRVESDSKEGRAQLELDLPGSDTSTSAPVATESPDPPQQAPVGCLNAFRSLLDQPIHSSWFFDIGDLAHVGAVPPPPLRTSKKWRTTTAAALAGSGEQQRLMANVAYMAR